MNAPLAEYLEKFKTGRELAAGDAEAFFDRLIAEDDVDLLAELLAAWRQKGVTENEIFGLAAVMRSRMVRIVSNHERFVDSVGTGGSRAKTFNVSTAAAFVAAGAGVAVAKHGNRAASSKTGSADALSELGVKVDVEPSLAERCLNEIGACFMFAPKFHRLSPMLAEARRRLGTPTVFNSLGPLCNPASAPHQLIGVYSRELVAVTANVLARLGTRRSWVVHGEDGLDEITLRGRTFVAETDESGAAREFELSPHDFGLANGEVNLPRAASATESAAIIRSVLGNERLDEPSEKIVLLNAAATIHLAGTGETLADSLAAARESLRSGSAAAKLAELAAMTNKTDE
ncbi:MAG: anthranilate phosphoribosyltransferase [Pyrinomonadaceae bacterium]